MTLTSAQTRERMRGLPEKLREVLDASESLEKVENIGEKYRLHLDQIADLDGLITEVIVGAEKREDFISELMRRASLDRELATKITTEVNQEIFLPIRELLIEKTSVAERPEEDSEEETGLTKESLLREIERPTPSVFRPRPPRETKETASNGSSLVGAHSDKMLGQDRPSPEILQEISGGKVRTLLEAPIGPEYELPPPQSLEQEKGTGKETGKIPIAPTPTPALKAQAVPEIKDRLTSVVGTPRTVTEIKPIKPLRRDGTDPYREPIK